MASLLFSQRGREREGGGGREGGRDGETRERIEGGHVYTCVVTFTCICTQLLRNGKEKEQDTPSHQRGHPVVEDVDRESWQIRMRKSSQTLSMWLSYMIHFISRSETTCLCRMSWEWIIRGMNTRLTCYI